MFSHLVVVDMVLCRKPVVIFNVALCIQPRVVSVVVDMVRLVQPVVVAVVVDVIWMFALSQILSSR